VSEEIAELIVECRRKHPTWGPRKVLVVLSAKRPELVFPAASTAGALLSREGLVHGRQRRRLIKHPHEPVVEALEPNSVWTADFKGQFRMGDGAYCYPLTIADQYSRYLLGTVALRSTATAAVRRVFERTFRESGLPLAIRSDNGMPFAAAGVHGLSLLSVWWIQLGIVLQRIERGHPEQNGAHERMHRTLKAETARPPAGNQQAQQKLFDAFRLTYNTERPHEALGQKPPATQWTPSLRAFPNRLPAPSYPGHFEVRLVSSGGYFGFKRRQVFLSECLCHQHIGIEETGDGVWSIHFYDVLLARWDERTGRLCSG
jgi:transposase InsO family protein